MQLQLERDLFGAWLRWLRGEESARARRGFESAMDSTNAALRASGDDSRRRHCQRLLHPAFCTLPQAFQQDRGEGASKLTVHVPPNGAGGEFFGGRDVSLVDCVFASSLERIAASILYYKGLQVL